MIEHNKDLPLDYKEAYHEAIKIAVLIINTISGEVLDKNHDKKNLSEILTKTIQLWLQSPPETLLKHDEYLNQLLECLNRFELSMGSLKSNKIFLSKKLNIIRQEKSILNKNI
ncbi:hypothetical protein ACIMS1_004526 [Vibrio harveyi]